MKPCPHCEDTENGFIVKAQARGPIEHHFDDTGALVESSWDRVYTETRRVVRCGKCFKIRRDVRLTDDRRIVENA